MQEVIRKSWYQEPWVWFNLLLLSAAVIAASWMSVIAVRNSPAELGSRWYNDGALAKRIRHEEVMIGSVHLVGDLAVSVDGVLTLTLQHDTSASKQILDAVNVAALQLYIEHPTAPDQDEIIKLTRIKENIYSGKLTGALSGKRKLLISPDSDQWYLTASAYFPPVDHIKFLPEMG